MLGVFAPFHSCLSRVCTLLALGSGGPRTPAGWRDLVALVLVSRGLGGVASAFPALTAPAACHFFCLLRAPPCQGVSSSGTGPVTQVCLSRAQDRRGHEGIRSERLAW